MISEEYLRKYADDVLKLCSFYIEDEEEARECFMLTFAQIGHEAERKALYSLARSICLSKSGAEAADQDPDWEKWLYIHHLGLTKREMNYILRHKKTKMCQSCHFLLG